MDKLYYLACLHKVTRRVSKRVRFLKSALSITYLLTLAVLRSEKKNAI